MYTKKQIYQAALFVYNIFKNIPEERWLTHHLGDGKNCCALGFFSPEWTILPNITFNEEYVLQIAVKNAGVTAHREVNWSYFSGPVLGTAALVCVNNGCCYEYTQPTPKQRVLAFMQDILKANIEHIDITKELATLSVVSEVADSFSIQKSVPTGIEL